MTESAPRCLIGAAIAALLITIAAITPGCAIPEEERWTVRDTPLEVDPTEYIQIAGWWSNGMELLHVDSGGRYRLYDSPTHAQPLHEGRWHRETHTRLRLEPYTGMDVEPLSVEILRRDEEYLLRVPGYADFRRTEAPEPPLRLRPPPIEPASSTA